MANSCRDRSPCAGPAGTGTHTRRDGRRPPSVDECGPSAALQLRATATTARRTVAARRRTCTIASIADMSWRRTAASGNGNVGAERERLDPGERVVGAVRVHGRKRTVVSGVARLQHVERFAAAHLADDDAIGAHAQRAANELAATPTAPFLRVAGRASSRTTCGCSSRSSAVSSMVTIRSDGSIARASALQHVVFPELVAPDTTMFHPRPDHGFEEAHRFGMDAERREGNGARAEPADREARTVGREWRQHRVQARAVGEPGIDHRRRGRDAGRAAR